MRIAVFHELPKGGARRAVNEIAKQLKNYHTVDLYLVDEVNDASENKFFTKKYFFKFTPKIWTGKNWRVRLYKDTIELFHLYFLHKEIASKISAKKYDVVFIHSSKFTEAPFILRFANKNKIFYCHDPHYRMLYEPLLGIPKDLDFFRYNYERLNRIIRKYIDKTNIQNADIVLANSRYTQKGVKKAYGIESTICYLGVDQKIFKPGDKKDYDIFYIGSKEPVDGYPLLQDVLKRLQRSLKIKLLFVESEWISDDRILARYYARSKIVACFARNEPLGLVPLEAMACGSVVVATNEAGHKETVIEGITGVLVPRNASLIAKKIKRLLSQPKMLRKISEKSRNNILEQWTWRLAARRIENIFLTLQ